jgi:hypothetical protein
VRLLISARSFCASAANKCRMNNSCSGQSRRNAGMAANSARTQWRAVARRSARPGRWTRRGSDKAKYGERRGFARRPPTRGRERPTRGRRDRCSTHSPAPRATCGLRGRSRCRPERRSRHRCWRQRGSWSRACVRRPRCQPRQAGRGNRDNPALRRRRGPAGQLQPAAPCRLHRGGDHAVRSPTVATPGRPGRARPNSRGRYRPKAVTRTCSTTVSQPASELMRTH